MVNILKFILGQCGYGKTTKVYELIKEKIEAGEEKIILIVPEQISFENEKKLLEFLGNQDFKNVTILSFDRIFDFVSRILRIPPYENFNSITKTLLMGLALKESVPNLKLLSTEFSDSEAIETMIETLEKFKSSKITPEILDNLAKKIDQKNFQQKLSECKIILENYEKILKSHFEKPVEDLDLITNLIKKNEIFGDYIVFADEFTNFTPQQFAFLEQLLSQAKETFFAFCLEENFETADEFSLFAPVIKTIKNITKLAKKKNIKITDPIILEKNLRLLSNDLKILEENIFKPMKKTSNKIPENIEIYNATDIYDECNFVAKRIKKLIFENDYSYKDFVVLSRNLESYTNTFENVFLKYEIPFFISNPLKITETNLVTFILSAFDIIFTNFETNEILRFLKTSFSGLETEEISLLENYVILWGLNKKKWLSDFTLHPEGFIKNFSKDHEKTLKKINELKNRFIPILINFKEKITNSTGENISKAVYNLILEFKIPEKIKKNCENFLKQNKIMLAETQAKIWDTIIGILSELHKILKDEKISKEDYASFLQTIISSTDISFVPQNIDDVMIGSAEKIKLSSPKIIFLIGAVEGEFPKAPGDFKIFTSSEIKIFEENETPIYDDIEAIALKERFLAYIAISSPIKKLFLSWPNSNENSKNNLPSEIIRETKNVFPKLQVSNKFSENLIDQIWTEKNAFEVLAKNFKSEEEIPITLKKIFEKNINYEKKLKLMTSASNEKILNFKNPKTSEKLFGENLLISASQIEKFYSCRFGYFCQYGLKAKPQKKAEFNSIEHGNFIHYLMEKILKKHLNKKLFDIPTSTIKKEINFFAEKFVDTKLGGWENKPKKFKYFFERCKTTAEILIDHTKQEFKNSEFSYIDCELKIAESGEIKPLKIILPNGNQVEIEGKVDRVDSMKKNGKNYIRIVDYKTGKKDFNLSDVIFGLNMQMLIYLMAIENGGQNRYGDITPAGVLYMPSIFPIVNTENFESNSEISKKIKKKLRMNGLILEDINVINGMESNSKGIYIPVAMASGEIKKNDSTISKIELKTIKKYIEKKIVEMAIKLNRGEIYANPIKIENPNCDWCEFKAICGFESNNFVEIKKTKKEETIKQMGGEDLE